MDTRIKDVVDGIKMKVDMRDDILSNLNSKSKNKKIEKVPIKAIIAICSIALIFIMESGILSILNPNKDIEAKLSDKFLGL